MPKAQHRLTPADILPLPAYEQVRKERRTALLPIKQRRRVEVGPFTTFYFESYETMWLQVHEMLRIEKGGEAQIADELDAYNPLIPQGRELVATMMIEIEDPLRRANALARLGGIETTVFLDIGGARISATWDEEVERTDEAGKTSSVHFLHFPFTEDQIARFRDPATMVILGVGHTNYAHMAVVSADARTALADDFD